MKIAFITDSSPLDINAWYGTIYHFFQGTLQEAYSGASWSGHECEDLLTSPVCK